MTQPKTETTTRKQCSEEQAERIRNTLNEPNYFTKPTGDWPTVYCPDCFSVLEERTCQKCLKQPT